MGSEEIQKKNGEHPGDPNHQNIFPKSIAIQWEAYCDTNGRSSGAQKTFQPRGTGSTAIQIGGVLQCKLEVYCDVLLRSMLYAIVVVVVSGFILKQGNHPEGQGTLIVRPDVMRHREKWPINLELS